MDGTLVWTIIGVSATTLGLAAAGLWTYNESVKKQFSEMQTRFDKTTELIFRRMDENKKSYWENFVNKEIHVMEFKNMKERHDEHYQTLLNKIDDLAGMIKEIKKGGA